MNADQIALEAIIDARARRFEVLLSPENRDWNTYQRWVKEQSIGHTEFADLTPRLRNLLMRSFYRTRAEVALATDDMLLASPNLGPRTLHQIREQIPHDPDAILAVPREIAS